MLHRNIKDIRRIASQIQAMNRMKDLSPTLNQNVGDNFVALPEKLTLYAAELERRVNIWADYWRATKSSVPGIVDLTRQKSLYERIRSTGRYHQTRLLRLLNVAREIQGYPIITQRAFTLWLNRFEKRRARWSNNC